MNNLLTFTSTYITGQWTKDMLVYVPNLLKLVLYLEVHCTSFCPILTTIKRPTPCDCSSMHSRTTEVEYGAVVEQLEQERQEASKRSQRLQEKLKEIQKERDSALKKTSEYKAKLAEARESDRNEMVALQSKVAKVKLYTSWK